MAMKSRESSSQSLKNILILLVSNQIKVSINILQQSRNRQSGRFDTLMIQHSIFDQQAERGTFAAARAQGVGIMCMSAARGAFTSAEQLQEVCARLDPSDPPSLEFLLQGEVTTYVDAAYGFASACPDLHTIVVGTGVPDHLSQSASAVLRAPLPAEHVDILKERFGHLDGSLLWKEGE